MSSADIPDKVLSELRRHRGALTISAVAGIGISVVNLLQPQIIGQLIASVEQGQSLSRPLLLFAVCISCLAALTSAQQYILGSTSEGIVLGLREKVVRRAYRASVVAVEREGGARTTALIVNDPPIVESAMTSAIVHGGAGLVMMAGATFAALKIDPIAFGAAFAVASSSIAVALVAGRPVRKARREIQRLLAGFAASQHDAFDAYAVVVAFGANAAYEGRALGLLEEVRREGTRMARMHALVGPLSDLLLNISFASAVVASGIHTARGDLSFAQFIVFIMYFQLATAPVGTLAHLLVQIKEGQASGDRVQEGIAELSQAPPVQTADPIHTSNGARSPRGPALHLKDVHFSYGGTPVLKGLDLVVPAGSSVALVGRSGAGKSTALALASKFLLPDSGSVVHSGIAGSSPAGAVGYVDQKAAVVIGSIKENLLMERSDISDETLIETLQNVGLGTYASPAGLSYAVASKGSNLSGGERQRLAIARALVGKPGLLILDEPTANLDSVSEQIIVELLLSERHSPSVLLVAHRASTVAACDKAVVLEGGIAIASGRHTDLVRNSDTYREVLGIPKEQ